MDKLEAMKVFTEVVNQQGFAAAGRQLGLSRAVVNNLVMRLEADLGVQLLQRTTRRVSPTDAGRAYYERCLNILADVEEADLAIAQLQAEPKGTLRMNAPMSFGTLYLAPAIAAFMAQYPELHVQLTLSDRFVDPIEEGFDVTLRIADINREEGLITQAIAPIDLVVCASPQYLKHRGIPPTPQALKHHDCLHYGQMATGVSWRLQDEHNKAISVTVHCRYYSNNGEVLREAALQDLGITLLPTFIVGEALKKGQLQPLLCDYVPPSLTAYIAYAQNRYLSTKIQLLTDFLKNWFQEPSWQG